MGWRLHWLAAALLARARAVAWCCCTSQRLRACVRAQCRLAVLGRYLGSCLGTSALQASRCTHRCCCRCCRACIAYRPSSSLLQDKFAQKQHFAAAGVPVAPFADVPDESALQAAAASFGFPFMLKSKR